MSIFFRKHRSKAAKIAGIAFFALLMFVNIQLTTNPSKSGDIDLFGLKISLITPTTIASGGFQGYYTIGPCSDRGCIGGPYGSYCWKCVQATTDPYCTLSNAYCVQ